MHPTTILLALVASIASTSAFILPPNSAQRNDQLSQGDSKIFGGDTPSTPWDDVLSRAASNDGDEESGEWSSGGSESRAASSAMEEFGESMGGETSRAASNNDDDFGESSGETSRAAIQYPKDGRKNVEWTRAVAKGIRNVRSTFSLSDMKVDELLVMRSLNFTNTIAVTNKCQGGLINPDSKGLTQNYGMLTTDRRSDVNVRAVLTYLYNKRQFAFLTPKLTKIGCAKSFGKSEKNEKEPYCVVVSCLMGY
ncbi:hypothetical protein HDU67_010325 [Dinochytrium kinnereticum]|nr:hypothetical protein HDU67_010325 [Dinochytrium kinnereticum]